MAKFEHNPGNGSLFKQENRTSDRQPVYSGSGKVAYPPSESGGVLDLDLAAWIKEGQNGKYLSVSLKEDTYNKESSYTPGSDPQEDSDDELPWED